MSGAQDKHKDLYKERHPLLTKENAVIEATRCINCYDAPCIHACPTDINIPQFISRIANGDLEGSAQAILESNILGYSCSTVCPVEVLCEGSCVYNNLEDPPIRIGDLQKYALHDFYKRDNMKQVDSLLGGKNKAKKQNIKAVAIGGGPASLSFAAYICLNGGEADIFDKASNLGGLNTYGVAPYKLGYEESIKEVEFVRGLGVSIYEDKNIRKDEAEKLLKDYDAVFIGIGLGDDSFPLPIKELKNISGSLPLIARLKEKDFGMLKDVNTVLVIGGGNTALDVAQELALCGVPEISMAYRREEKDMSGYKHELKYARSLGVELLTNHNPAKILDENGSATGVEFETSQGKKIISADLIVFATGQLKHPVQKIFPELKINDNGTIIVNDKMQTSIGKVYAGGDCINGGKEVVNAVADGREAARHALLSNNQEVYYGRFSS